MVSITLEVWGFCNFYTNFKYHHLPQVDNKQIIIKNIFLFISSVQSVSHVRLFATPWTTERQASLSITNSQRLPKLMSIKWNTAGNRMEILSDGVGEQEV